MEIKILDPVNIQLDPVLARMVAPALSYKSEYYRQGQYRKIRKETNKCLINARNITLFGFIPTIQQMLIAEGLPPATITGEDYLLEPMPVWDTELPGIEAFDVHQHRLIKQGLHTQRGVLLAPTGYGKTVIAAGLLHGFREYRRLFLSSSVSLVRQTMKDFVEYGLGTPTRVQGAVKKISPLTVATVKSMLLLPPEEYSGYFDVVVVDEAHHIGDLDGEYAKVLRSLIAPIRLGVTATVSPDPARYLIMTGLLGPVLEEVTQEQGVEIGRLAEPRVRILPVPLDHRIRQIRKYAEVYQEGVVANQVRNELIVSTAVQYIERGHSVLILVQKITHGMRLRRLFNTLTGIKCMFLQGSTDGDVRERARAQLTAKDLMVVIATKVWNEGINIPTLDVVMNVAGGKSEIETLQRLGRGLRATKEKTTVLLVDLFDCSHPYLIDHFGKRVSLYCEKGWLGKEE